MQAFQHHVQGELRRKDTRIRGLETAVRQLQSALCQNTTTHEWLATEIERLQRTVLHKYTQNDPAADPAQLSLDAQVAVAMLADTPLAAHTAPSNNDDWMFDGYRVTFTRHVERVANGRDWNRPRLSVHRRPLRDTRPGRSVPLLLQIIVVNKASKNILESWTLSQDVAKSYTINRY